MPIGTYIRQQRNKKRMSQQELADLTGVSQPTISNWESESSHPDGEEIKKLADALNVPMEELLPEVTHLKVVQQNRDQSHSNNQHISPQVRNALADELLATQRDLIEQLKARIAALEAENARYRQLSQN
jgi:transcriptional regulator with XRE-family HTH domain